MLIDANLLIFAADADSPFHAAAATWLTSTLNAPTRAGISWASFAAFLRISTNVRATASPLSPGAAWAYVERWLAAPSTWVPLPTDRHAEVFGGLITRYQLRGNLIPDADLAALAVEHGLILNSTDTDFARFTEIRWENPLSGRAR